MQQKLREQRRMLDQIQAAYDARKEAVPRRHEAPRARPHVIPIEMDSEHYESEDEEEEEYHRRCPYQGRHKNGPKSLMLEELEKYSGLGVSTQ